VQAASRMVVLGSPLMIVNGNIVKTVVGPSPTAPLPHQNPSASPHHSPPHPPSPCPGRWISIPALWISIPALWISIPRRWRVPNRPYMPGTIRPYWTNLCAVGWRLLATVQTNHEYSILHYEYISMNHKTQPTSQPTHNYCANARMENLKYPRLVECEEFNVGVPGSLGLLLVSTR